MTTRRLRWLAVLGVAAMLSFGACGSNSPKADSVTSVSITTPTIAAGSASPTSTSSGETVDCPTVGFTPNSEDAASSIKATGLTCAEADAFVRIVGQKTSSGGPDSVDAEGYHCVRTSHKTDPLPVSSYSCTNGSKRVTFDRS